MRPEETAAARLEEAAAASLEVEAAERPEEATAARLEGQSRQTRLQARLAEDEARRQQQQQAIADGHRQKDEQWSQSWRAESMWADSDSTPSSQASEIMDRKGRRRPRRASQGQGTAVRWQRQPSDPLPATRLGQRPQQQQQAHLQKKARLQQARLRRAQMRQQAWQQQQAKQR